VFVIIGAGDFDGIQGLLDVVEDHHAVLDDARGAGFLILGNGVLQFGEDVGVVADVGSSLDLAPVGPVDAEPEGVGERDVPEA
jgi:hypothetical protein